MYFLKIDSVHVLFQAGSYIPTEGLLPKGRNVGTLFTKQVFVRKIRISYIVFCYIYFSFNFFILCFY